MTYRQLLKQQANRLNSYQGEYEAIKILVLELSGFSGADFVLQLDNEIEEEKLNKLTKAIDSYLIDNVPIQYILGYTYFLGHKIFVNNDVLIPRFETEELVGHALSLYDEYFDGLNIKVVDIGTGSGAIAIALALEEPKMDVYATDISPKALEVAQRNANYHDVKVSFLQGNLLEPLKHLPKFDMIISNPPYIPDEEEVDAIIKNNEPHLALFGGAQGLNFYDEILKTANMYLNPFGLIVFEHSYNKKKEIEMLAKKYFPNSFVECFTDMQKKDRITIITVKDVKK